MKERLFIGKVKPYVKYVGEKILPTRRKDSFGELKPGYVRKARIVTEYGKIYVPIKFLGKKVIVTLEEVEE